MAVLTPDSETSELHERAFRLVLDGRSPDEVCARLPLPGGEESDAAMWLYSWAVAQQCEERDVPRLELPVVTSE